MISINLGETSYTQAVDGFDLTTLSDTVSVVNGVSDGSVSKDNVLKMYAEGATQVHSIRNNDDASFFASKVVRIEFDYYIPSAQTNVDSGVVRVAESTFTTFDTVGSWTSASVEITDTASSGTEGVQFRLRSSTAGSPLNFLGAGDPNDDILYLTNIVVYVIDGPAKADASANDLDDVTYLFNAVPSVSVTYQLSGSTLNATFEDLTTNPFQNFRIYEATDHKAQFSNVADVTLPYTRSVSVGTGNFKHKVNYVASGTKDGNTYVVESQSSRPAYYINDRNKI